VFRLNLGAGYETLKLYDEAIREYMATLSANWKNPDALNALSGALAKKGDFDGAIAVAKKTLDLYPENAMAHYILGWSYEAKSDRTNAEKHYLSAIQGEPDWQLPKERLKAIQALPP
jgi:tetratricopeptide (TPR) repeat protein